MADTVSSALVEEIARIIKIRLPWLSVEAHVQPCAWDIALFLAEYAAKNKVKITNDPTTAAL